MFRANGGKDLVQKPRLSGFGKHSSCFGRLMLFEHYLDYDNGKDKN
jgi:hypothetical protein